MDIIVLLFEVIVVRRSAEVAVPVNVNFKVVCDDGPLPNIEFSFIVQQGLFNIFLDDPGTS